jgi:NAD-dependent deacetylase
MTESSYALATRLIAESERIAAFTGAGISTPSGIPDFRSPDSGLWQHVDPFRVASITGFRKNPIAFYEWVRPLAETLIHAEPNEAHFALAALEATGRFDCVITQNIDNLHQRAGSVHVHELHGHIREATCIHCFREYEGLPVIDTYLSKRVIPRCPDCGNLLKPNIILFGEQLPMEQLQRARNAIRASDLLIIVGSSLAVAPASDLPLLAQRTGSRIMIINLEPTPSDAIADVILHADAAIALPRIVRDAIGV